MTQGYEGRLELTWTNKDLRLLAAEDGSYEWVSPADYRVSEVRLLDGAGSEGKTGPSEVRARDNLLIRGDALNALTSLAELPEFAKELVGKVKLAYLDPPFNTQQSFLQYDDALEHSVWLTMMRDRLLQVKKLLSPDGSVWVHLDDAEMPYCRVMMDELFGRENFVASVVWQKVYAPRNDAKTFSTDHDYILVYARERQHLSLNKLGRTAEQDALFKNPDDDPRGPWQSDNLTVNKNAEQRRNLAYDIINPETGEVYPFNPNRVWAYEEPRMAKLIAERRILWPASVSGRPRIKRYLSEVSQGRVPQTWWEYQEVGHNQEAKREMAALNPNAAPFATPKPERLLERIVGIATNPGDLVLDCFLGSGTTAAVAQKMRRRWVGVERSAENLDSYVIPRLTRVVRGEDPGGVTAATEWQGGGGFRILDVSPSMFVDDGGVIVLADWATNGKLGEATAAQLGFEYELDAPFSGRKGRTRLAVIDGLVSTDVVKLLAAALADDERLTVCGTAIDSEAGPLLRELRAGSSVRKIPASILEDYRRSSRWAPRPVDDSADTETLAEATETNGTTTRSATS